MPLREPVGAMPLRDVRDLVRQNRRHLRLVGRPCSTPRLIQTGPPGNANALISGKSATENVYRIFRSRAAPNEPLSDIAKVTRHRGILELWHLLAYLLVCGPPDFNLLLDRHHAMAATLVEATNETAKSPEPRACSPLLISSGWPRRASSRFDAAGVARTPP